MSDQVYTLIQAHTSMKGETGERWQRLCEEAAVEQDPLKLMQLVGQINQLLLEKDRAAAWRFVSAGSAALFRLAGVSRSNASFP